MDFSIFSRLTARTLAVMALAVAAFSAQAAWLTNRPVTVTQPDGSQLQVLASGDEYFNWLHDADGFPLLRHPQTGWFVYTRQTSDEMPEPTELVVGRTDPAAAGLNPGLLVPMDVVARRRAERAVPDTRTEGGPTPAPKTGTLNNIVIFIRFKGDANFATTTTTYNNRFNAAAPANSMRAYFLEASYNTLTVDTGMFPPPSGETVLSYEDINPRSYYQKYNATSNPNGYQDGQQADREHSLLKRAVEFARTTIPANLVVDGDNDGNVDNVCFIVKGNTEGWADLLWPHAWALYSYDVRINNKRVWTYNFQLESWIEPGVLCHELAHSLGAPDLYHYNATTPSYSPCGGWDLMDGTRNPPQHMGAWMKFKYTKWVASVPEVTASGTYTLNPITSSTNNCLKIKSPNSTTEFFVVEYRRRTGTFEGNLPGSGLLVYRIRNGVNGNASGPPDEVYLYRPGGSCTAGGTVDSAYLASGVGRTAINDTTNPTTFLTNCSAGGLDISQVGAAGATISFKVTLPGPQPTAVAFDQQPGGARAGSLLSPQPRVKLIDPTGAVATAYSSPVTLTVVSGPGQLGGTATVNAVRGIATFGNLTLSQPGAYVLRASSTGMTSADSQSIAVTAVPTQLVWSVQPAGGDAGDPLAPAPAVSLRDENGNLDVNATESVTITLQSAPTDASLSGTLSAAAVQGLAVFSNLRLSKAGDYVLRASAPNLPNAPSATFAVIQTPTALAVQRQPSGAVEAQPFSTQPIFRVVDKGGRTVLGYTGEVTVAIKPGTGPTDAVLSGAVGRPVADGYATFTDLAIDRAGIGYILTATAPGLQPTETSSFAVTVPTGLRARQTSPDDVTVSVLPPAAPVISATVNLRHNPAQLTPGAVTPAAGWTVNSSFTSGDIFVVDLSHVEGQAAEGPVCAVRFNAASGFSGLTSPVTLTSDSSIVDQDFNSANAIPATIAFIPGGHLAFTAPPAGAEPGATLPAVSVSMRDGAEATVTDFAGSVRIALKPGTGEPGALLLGTMMQPSNAGVAIFGDLTIDKAGTGYVLSASYDTWASADSAAFAIGAAPITFADVATALNVHGGAVEASPADIARLNVEPDGESSGKVDVLDAVRLARKAAGLE